MKQLNSLLTGISIAGIIITGIFYGDSTKQTRDVSGLYNGIKGGSVKISDRYYELRIIDPSITSLIPYQDSVAFTIEEPRGNHLMPGLFPERVVEIEKK